MIAGDIVKRPRIAEEFGSENSSDYSRRCHGCGAKVVGQMTCKYCDVKKPRDGARWTVGYYPVGKPILQSSEWGYVVIAHIDGCAAIPDEDKWTLNWMVNGCGTYIEINNCPICGHDLRKEAD